MTNPTQINGVPENIWRDYSLRPIFTIYSKSTCMVQAIAFALITITCSSICFAEEAIPLHYYGTYQEKQIFRDYSVDCEKSKDPDCGLFTDTSEVHVRHASAHLAFVEIDIRGENGHSCALTGYGNLKGNVMFVKRSSPLLPSEEVCTVHISFGENKIIRIEGRGSCIMLCGSRMSFSYGSLRKISR